MGRIALVYTLGFLFFNMSYGRLAASFAETVRGLEPLFSFAFVRLLGVRGGLLSAPSAVALATLLVGGVISCASQTFDARGLAFGLASNCCFAARSIYVSMLQDRLPTPHTISLYLPLELPSRSLVLPCAPFCAPSPPPHTHPYISLHLPTSP